MLNSPEDFFKLLKKKFRFQLTESQDELFSVLADFTFSRGEKECLVIRGYAGTGKTSSMTSYVNSLTQTKYRSVLLAPTGRAAKVLGQYTGKSASTLHRKIYKPQKQKAGGIRFVRQKNSHTNTVFIVDESSMLSDRGQGFGEASILEDLFDYVFNGFGNKLILIGDSAQLPPIHYEDSPALDVERLNYHFHIKPRLVQLTEVVRQESDSSILENATVLREDIEDYFGQDFKFDLRKPDLIRLEDSHDILDAIYSCFDREENIEQTAFIVRSNKRANQYNQQIRSQIRGQDAEISTGDYIMAVKNNYFWLPEGSQAGFIANGDICEVLQVHYLKDLYGFKFAYVKLRMVDYPQQASFDTMVLLDTLDSEGPALTQVDNQKLYERVMEDFEDIPSKYKRLLELRKNPYFNALQIKFSYAVTCHKSQGGQWKNVFIEKPYLPDGQSISYLRWLYTALTRSTEKVYLIGFKEEDLIQI
jgi:exodeoxyribonuclease-5